MRVAEHDDIGVIAGRQFCRSRTPDFVAVADVYPDVVDREDDFFAQLGLARWIRVAKHCFDGCDQSELVQNLGAADIPGVKNELDPRQRLAHSGAEKPMCIGDESHNASFRV